MHLELPERLLPARDVLTRSLPGHPLEKAPAIPPDLAAELAARFVRRTTPWQEEIPRPWRARVRSLLATPGFGAVAAAVVVLGVALPMFVSGPEEARETFRGGGGPALPAEQVRIYLVGENAAIRAAIENSAIFEASALVTGPRADAASAAAGPKVIVDFTTDTVTAFDAGGRETGRDKLPAEAKEVPAALMKTVATLQ